MFRENNTFENMGALKRLHAKIFTATSHAVLQDQACYLENEILEVSIGEVYRKNLYQHGNCSIIFPILAKLKDSLCTYN
jgi:hypothetical protein